MQKLIEGLRHFQANAHWEKRELFERSVHGQKPHALLITCSDSRILPDQLMQADPGDLFVHRNAGNLVPPPETPSGEAATIEYAVANLGVTDLIVCGHYRCGAVKALLDSGENTVPSPVHAWLCHAAGTLVAMEKDHSALKGQARWDKAVEQNVLVQLASLARHPAVAAGLAAGKLRLHAWVLRFESSEVLAFDQRAGVFSPLLDMPEVHPAMPARSAEPAGPPVQATQANPECSQPVPRRPKWFDALRGDAPASLVVFMVALPMCLAIAKACGAPAEAGLITGIVGGIVVGVFAGSPLVVSGPAAGLIVVLLDVVQQQGIEVLGAAVFLAGALQIAAGALGLGQWFRAVSPAVILGMLAGIGAVLFIQQFHVAVDDAPSRSAVMNFVNMPQAVWDIFDSRHRHGHPGHLPAALIGILTLAVLLLWRPIMPTTLAAIPAVLVAIALTTIVATLLKLPIQRVEFDSLASAVAWLDFSTLPGRLVTASFWQTALTIAMVASAETLLCAAAVDKMHRGPRSRFDRELAAQGIGNSLCGLLGALPMAGGIVRSSANVQAGAHSRLATILHGFWLLLFLLLGPAILRLIPTAALAAILVLTGIKLIEVQAIRELWKENRGEGLICLATAITVIAVDLLTGAMLGIGLSVLKLIHTFSRLRIRRTMDTASDRVTLVLEGSATFLRLPKLAAELEKVPPGVALHIDLKGLSYIDHACMTLLMDWQKLHEATGGKLILDWETLRARFRHARPRPRLEPLEVVNRARP